ncbi:GNAT family N-acetyltransferase [Pseudaminobacter soli (ex Li et al. 2025)]|uniref:N-acetyltransferase n=1 Tax=Pseudaminobacter soli (ex Li et al. 2025) TaxID=1295366 RepID=A0A2P7SKU8_9HYPH|nr:GNAT family N-acetyltransferase [Mesorhizobium soli]PSJ63087.1 N-acetyltransferase [Mesorhizobium soli]
MNSAPIPPCRIVTERLVLRPTGAADAERAFEIQSDWEVTRMLRMASFPPDREEIRRWFADHEREWAGGEAYRFAVELRGRLIGVADIDEISGREAELGYWFERVSCGRGYALEAAQAVVRFAFGAIGLSKLRSGHAADNQASGNVLLKLGFQPLDTARVVSRPRGQEITQRRYVLSTPAIS